MAWMTAEAAVPIAAGIIASSIAPVGFGLDSVIEFAAAAVVVWQLRGEAEDRETGRSGSSASPSSPSPPISPCRASDD